MFVVEKFFNDFDARQKAYELRVQKWIDENDNYYSHRTESGYARQYGYSPKDKAKDVLKLIATVLVGTVIFFCVLKFVTIEVEDTNKSNVTSQEVKE